MDKESNIAEYLIAFISEYAKAKHISDIMACNMLKDHGILKFLEEHYDIAHTLTFESVVELVDAKCK